MTNLKFYVNVNAIMLMHKWFNVYVHRAGLLNATIALDLSLYLLKERDYVPWATALEHFQAWSKYLSEAAPYRLFLQYMKDLLAPVAQSLGWEDNGTHMYK